MNELAIIYLKYCVLEMNHRKERFIIAVQDTTDDVMLIFEEVNPDASRYGVIEHYYLFLHALTKEQALKILNDMKENRRASARSKLYHLLNNRTFMTDGESDGPVMFDDLIPDEWYDSWKEMESGITFITPQGYGEKEVSVKIW